MMESIGEEAKKSRARASAEVDRDGGNDGRDADGGGEPAAKRARMKVCSFCGTSTRATDMRHHLKTCCMRMLCDGVLEQRLATAGQAADHEALKAFVSSMPEQMEIPMRNTIRTARHSGIFNETGVRPGHMGKIWGFGPDHGHKQLFHGTDAHITFKACMLLMMLDESVAMQSYTEYVKKCTAYKQTPFLNLRTMVNLSALDEFTYERFQHLPNIFWSHMYQSCKPKADHPPPP